MDFRPRPPASLAGGWEAGLLLFMIAVYAIGVFLNPALFGSTDAISSVLSGGRQQSVAIAHAVSFAPHVVVFDEPTVNLSVTATDQVPKTMLELKREGDAQVIISHRMTDIFAVGDRVIAATTERDVLELIVSGTPEA